MNINDILIDSNLLMLLGIIVTVLLILTIFLIIMLFKMNKIKKRYNLFMSGFYENKDLEKILETMVNQVKYQEGKSIDLGKRLGIIENNIKYSIQKAGIIRYKAFDNIGGDQSFSIALLDKNDNGFVITSIYNDGLSSMYGKEIKEGKSGHRLSEEELKVLEYAKNFSDKNIIEL